MTLREAYGHNDLMDIRWIDSRDNLVDAITKARWVDRDKTGTEPTSDGIEPTNKTGTKPTNKTGTEPTDKTGTEPTNKTGTEPTSDGTEPTSDCGEN
ncbi:hypothetical protein P3342_007393 [Pyrenophora teres f. teres]|nr:hypothetical protein P3342_007393 [Pyrenophora teres f. teres]